MTKLTSTVIKAFNTIKASKSIGRPMDMLGDSTDISEIVYGILAERLGSNEIKITIKHGGKSYIATLKEGCEATMLNGASEEEFIRIWSELPVCGG